MAINIKDESTDRIVRDLAAATGESITEAIATAAKERFDRLTAGQRPRRLADELNEIGLRCAALPVLDERSPEEILGYDERGLPT